MEDIEYIHLDETDSTNRYLKDYVSDQQHRMVVVRAEYQLSGRGQGSNHWESERGENLLFSVLTHPRNVAANKQFILSMASALSVKDLLDEYIGSVSIKWPNDVYYKDKKICGMLIENNLSGVIIKDSITGIGININQQHFVSDAPNPVSIAQVTGKKLDLEMLMQSFLDLFEGYIKAIDASNCDAIKEKYVASLYRRDGLHRYRDATGEFMAEFDSIMDDGHLVLKDEQGGKRKYAFKEVSFVMK